MTRANFIERTAILLVAASAWVSLDPYFTWHTRADLIIASFGSAVAGGLLFVAGRRPRWTTLEWAGLILVSLFVVYITAQSKVSGGHTRWVGVLPTLWAASLLDQHGRRRAFGFFSGLFAASCVPGLVMLILAALGVPLTFEAISHPSPFLSDLDMLNRPGVIFIGSANSVVLPWGGMLFRLCAMYDEPGMVGTVSGLLLAGYGYKLNHWRTVLLFLAGVFAFSLAFTVLTVTGLAVRAAISRSARPFLAMVPVLVSAGLAVGLISVGTKPGVPTRISVQKPTQPAPVVAVATTTSGTLRQEQIDNRIQPQMRELIQEYRAAGWRTKMLGIASDASSVRGGFSQSIMRLFTDHGVLGAALLWSGLLALAWQGWREGRGALQVLLFSALFLLSMYQRPVVWMPYALLIFVCGRATAAVEGR